LAHHHLIFTSATTTSTPPSKIGPPPTTKSSKIPPCLEGFYGKMIKLWAFSWQIDVGADNLGDSNMFSEI
jgi:hypothetical protein